MLSLAPPPPAVIGERAPVTLAGEPGLADVVTFGRQQRAAQAAPDDEEEERFFADTLAEYQWARDVAGLAPSTLARLTRPLIEVCEHYGLVPWRLTPRHVDRYFAGPGKRAGATVRQKLNRIDGYFAFLEQRYAGEVARRFGCAVESPVDPFNRPAHRGDFGLREAFMFAEGRELPWWYVEEIRGGFSDDPEHPEAPVWPSERLPGNIAALNAPVAPAVTPSTFRKALARAGDLYLTGPVTELYPHLLRHACATHYYEAGTALWEVQKILGHDWTTTTVRYICPPRATRSGPAWKQRAARCSGWPSIPGGFCEVEPALGGGPQRHLAAFGPACRVPRGGVRAVAEQGVGPVLAGPR